MKSHNGNPWGLTAAEVRTLEGMLRLGHRKYVAAELGLSVKTLDHQLLNARQRMGARTVLSAVVMYDRWVAQTEEAQRLRARLSQPIDYNQLIAACFSITKHQQGTVGCVQFAKGAEWWREQIQKGV